MLAVTLAEEEIMADLEEILSRMCLSRETREEPVEIMDAVIVLAEPWMVWERSSKNCLSEVLGFSMWASSRI